MRINMNETFTDMDGKPLLSNGTSGDVVKFRTVAALLLNETSDNKLELKDKVARGALLHKILSAAEEADLNVTELSLIRDLAGASSIATPWLFIQLDRMMEERRAE
jgi:hypothetical protein